MRTLQSELIEKGLYKKKKRHKKRQHHKKKQNKQQTEKLKQRDWEEIMGTNRPTYRRYRGSFRQS